MQTQTQTHAAHTHAFGRLSTSQSALLIYGKGQNVVMGRLVCSVLFLCCLKHDPCRESESSQIVKENALIYSCKAKF